MDYRGRLLQSLAAWILTPLQVRSQQKNTSSSKIHVSKDEEPIFHKKKVSRSKDMEPSSWSSLSTWLTVCCVILGSGAFGFISGKQYLSPGKESLFKNIKTQSIKSLSKAFGLTLHYVEITGISRLSPQSVLDSAQLAPESSLPLIDIYTLQQKLEAKPLIENASVRVLYPDRIILSVVERDIHALWQQNGVLYAIDENGRVLTSVQKSELDPFLMSLPYIIGPEANRHVKDYDILINHAGLLKSQIFAGIFINQRRWTLRLKNNMEIYLPEKESPLALELLSVLEQDHHILEKDIATIDMRLPDRVIFRLTPRAVTEDSRVAWHAQNKEAATKKRNM